MRPTADMATRTDNGSGHTAFACDVKDTTGRAALATGASDAPSSAYSPMDAAIGYASSVDTVAAPTPLCSPQARCQSAPGAFAGG